MQILTNPFFWISLIVIAIIYIEAKHNPKMLAKAAELAASDRTSVLIANIKSQRRMVDLKNLLPEIHATCMYNKSVTRRAEVLNAKYGTNTTVKGITSFVPNIQK